MRLLLSVFLLFLSFNGHCQVIDSLLRLLPTIPKNTVQHVDILNELGYSYWIRDAQKSIVYGNQAAQMAEGLSYIPGLARAKRVEGVAHWALGEPKSALENLTGSLELYGTLDDVEGMANCNLNMGMVYADIGENEKAMQLYNVAMDGFTSLNLRGRIATTFTKIGGIHLENGYYLDALSYFNDALKIHTDNNFSYGISEAHNRLASLYIKEGKPEQAEYHIRRSLEFGRKVDDGDGLVSNLILFGKLLRIKGDMELSEAHLKLALQKAMGKRLKNHKLTIFQELKELKMITGQLDSALYYSDRYLELRDSIFNATKSKQIAAIEFNMELTEKNKELAHAQERERSTAQMNWILFIGIWIILLLSFFLIKSLRQRNIKQRELAQQHTLMSAKELENQRLKHLELQQELDFKNKELTSYAINFIQRNELLESLREKLASLKKLSTAPAMGKELLDMEKILKQHSGSQKDWNDFKLHFEKVHVHFFTQLKDEFPSLSSNDMKVAALTRLNLSMKEMAIIMGISTESVKTARYRLRKKMQIGPEVALYDFLLGRNPST